MPGKREMPITSSFWCIANTVSFALLAGVLPSVAQDTKERPELIPQLDYVSALQLAPREDDPKRARWITTHDFQTYCGVVQWRDPKTGAVLRTIPLAARPEITDMSGSPVSTALSSGGTVLASTGKEKVLYWQNAQTGEVLHRFSDQRYPLTFSPNDEVFVSQEVLFQDDEAQFALVLRSVPEGGVLHRLALPSRVDRLAWSHDAKRLAGVGFDNGKMRLQVWDVARGRSQWTTEQQSVNFYQMWFMPDNRLAVLENKSASITAATGATHQVHIWSSDGESQTTLRHNYKFNDPDVRWSVLGDGRLLTSEVHRLPAPKPMQGVIEKRSIYLWDVPKAAAPRLLEPQENTLATTAKWKGQYYAPPRTADAGLASPVTLKRVRLVNGRVLVADDSRVWQAATGKFVRAFQPIPPRSSALDIAPDGNYFASAGGGGGGSSSGAFLGVWQMPTGKLSWHKAVSLDRSNGIGYSEAGSAWTTTLLFSKDGARVLITSAMDQPPLALYETRTGKQIWATKSGWDGGIGFIAKNAAWSSDNKRIAVTSGSMSDHYTTRVQIVDAANSKTLHSWDMPTPSSALAWSPDKQTIALATATGRPFRSSGYTWFDVRETMIELRNPRDGSVMSILRGASTDLKALQFSPSGALLAAGARDGKVYVWEIGSGKLLHTFHIHHSTVCDVMWNGDAQVVSVGEDGATKFWSTQDGKLLATALILQAPVPQADNVYRDTRRKGFGGGIFDQLPKIEWLLYTPDGYYDASPGADRFIRWRVGDTLFPSEKFKGQFYQPQKVRLALRG